MEENFTIDISNNGREMNFDARFVPFGYSYKILVNVNNIEVSFEPDENRNYRAIVQDQHQSNLKEKDKEIIKAIIERLGNLKD